MKVIASVCAVAALVATSGCATITRGRSQTWTVTTTPAGATASLSNGERCQTPCTLVLRRKYPFAVELCKSGYATVTAQILSHMSGAGGVGLAGNVILGGAIGLGVDLGTGATKDLTPNPLTVVLEAAETGCTAPSFPAVPAGGVTPELHARGRRSPKAD